MIVVTRCQINSISAGAVLQTPLGELTALPMDPLAGFKGA